MSQTVEQIAVVVLRDIDDRGQPALMSKSDYIDLLEEIICGCEARIEAALEGN